VKNFYIIGVSGRNSVPSLVSVGGIAPCCWCHGRNSARSLLSVGRIVSHPWCQREK
ncbi:unnamed protein product, partial [Staurois parvus]